MEFTQYKKHPGGSLPANMGPNVTASSLYMIFQHAVHITKTHHWKYIIFFKKLIQSKKANEIHVRPEAHPRRCLPARINPQVIASCLYSINPRDVIPILRHTVDTLEPWLVEQAL